jgi:hypothetical protein
VLAAGSVVGSGGSGPLVLARWAEWAGGKRGVCTRVRVSRAGPKEGIDPENMFSFSIKFKNVFLEISRELFIALKIMKNFV